MIVFASLVFSLSVFAENQSPKPNASCDNACIKKIQTIIDNYRKNNNISGLQVTLSFANQPMQVFSSGSKTIDGKNPVDADSRL